MEPLSDYFRDLDGDFIGLKKASDDVYVYNATDVLIQSTWELPIVVQWPESTVKFEFACTPSDISFGIVFVAAPDEDQDVEELEIETIEEMGRVDSNLEPITGSFEVPCEGVVFFLFDNNYDWTANKKITYLIEVMQPSFTLTDEIRTEKSVAALKDVVEELDVAYIRHADAQDCIEHCAADVYFLEEQIHALQSKLQARYEECDLVDETLSRTQRTMQLGHEAAPGLCIRMLNKHLLQVTLSYLDASGGANLVDKYWAGLMTANRALPASGPEKVPREPKLSRSEVKAALSRLHFAAKSESSRKLSSETSEQHISSSGKSHNIADGPLNHDLQLKSTRNSPPKQQQPSSILNAAQRGASATNVSEDSSSEPDSDAIGSAKGLASAPESANVGGHSALRRNGSSRSQDKVKVSFDEVTPSSFLQPHDSVVATTTNLVLSSDAKMPPGASDTPVKSTHSSQLTSYIENNSTRRKEESRNLEPPQVAESKKSRKVSVSSAQPDTASPQRSRAAVTQSGHRHRRHETDAAGKEGQLLQHVKKIRSEQQLTAMLEYIQSGFLKMETLSTEKRRIKKLIRAWNTSFEKRNGRVPTSSERKGHLRELYEEYQQVSLSLRIRSERMDEVLQSVGLDREGFQQLRQRQNLEW